MKLQSFWICAFVVALFTGRSFSQSPGLHSWKSNEGKVIEAEFIKLDAETLHMRKGGKAFQISLSKLAPESQQLAKKLAETPVEPTQSTGLHAFGFPAVQEYRPHLEKLEALLPKGVTDVALGMSKQELKAARAKHIVPDSFDGPPGGTLEMHGKDVALDRNSFWAGGKDDRLGQISLWSENTRITRDQCLALGQSLQGIYGKPTYVFELKAGRDIGFRWIKDGKSVILLLRADPDIYPTAQLWIDGPERLALEGIPLYPLVEEGKILPPNDLNAWFKKFLDRAYIRN